MPWRPRPTLRPTDRLACVSRPSATKDVAVSFRDVFTINITLFGRARPRPSCGRRPSKDRTRASRRETPPLRPLTTRPRRSAIVTLASGPVRPPTLRLYETARRLLRPLLRPRPSCGRHIASPSYESGVRGDRPCLTAPPVGDVALLRRQDPPRHAARLLPVVLVKRRTDLADLPHAVLPRHRRLAGRAYRLAALLMRLLDVVRRPTPFVLRLDPQTRARRGAPVLEARPRPFGAGAFQSPGLLAPPRAALLVADHSTRVSMAPQADRAVDRPALLPSPTDDAVATRTLKIYAPPSV